MATESWPRATCSRFRAGRRAVTRSATTVTRPCACSSSPRTSTRTWRSTRRPASCRRSSAASSATTARPTPSSTPARSEPLALGARRGHDDGAWRRRREAVQVHDLLPEGDERGAGHLEARDPERDPDDRDAEQDPREQVAEREPPAGEDKPQDVPDHAQALAPRCARDERAAERPEGVAGELERLPSERDPDDRDAEEHAGQHVGDRHPDPGEDEPEDVEERPHHSALQRPAIGPAAVRRIDADLRVEDVGALRDADLADDQAGIVGDDAHLAVVPAAERARDVAEVGRVLHGTRHRGRPYGSRRRYTFDARFALRVRISHVPRAFAKAPVPPTTGSVAALPSRRLPATRRVPPGSLTATLTAIAPVRTETTFIVPASLPTGAPFAFPNWRTALLRTDSWRITSPTLSTFFGVRSVTTRMFTVT